MNSHALSSAGTVKSIAQAQWKPVFIPSFRAFAPPDPSAGRRTLSPGWTESPPHLPDKGNCQLFMSVGPAPALPGKLYFNIYQGQNDWAKPQSRGSISALNTHCTSAWLKLPKSISEHKRKRNHFPGRHKIKAIRPCSYQTVTQL